MSYDHLPSRLPVGAKFVIESSVSGGLRVYRRHLEFPDGRVLRLPDRAASGDEARHERQRSRPA